MQSQFDLDKLKGMLSVDFARAILFIYIANIAFLTFITFLCQILNITFQVYTIICVITSIIFTTYAIINAITNIKSGQPQKDAKVIIGLILLSIACAVIALSFHRVGRIAVDEWYSTANPTYYLKNPTQSMGFETRTFYSGDKPFSSVAFLTAGGYEYILAAFSFITKISYLRVYYQLAAGLAAFLLPMAIFVLLSYFSTDTPSILLGTIAVICVEIITAEGAATPGGFAFIRIYEGKSIMLAMGIPLFINFVMEFLQSRTYQAWLRLFIVVTALCGLTTTSFMILPLLGLIVFIAYSITHRDIGATPSTLLKAAVSICGSFIYLLFYMTFVAIRDGIGNAVVFNSSYPATFQGYLDFFGPITAPTPFITILSFAIVLILAQGVKRMFLAWWMLLSILFALNPISGGILLILFRGIFYRIFYILPFPISAGIAIIEIYTYVKTIKLKLPPLVWYSSIFSLLIVSTFTIPSSIFRNQIYQTGDWSHHEEYQAARKIISATPKGVMLCPYPTAGAIRMLSADYPQLLTRDDMMTFYLGAQGRKDDADLRLDAEQFLEGNSAQADATLALLDRYPEIQSLVITRTAYSNIESGILNDKLSERGFYNKKIVDNYIVFSK